MNKANLIPQQRGSFTVEFAVVGLLFATLLVFSSDVIIKISMKGKLDRLSFSAVSIIKERTQLYSNGNTVDYTMTSSEVDSIYGVILTSMKRTTSSFDSAKFGMRFEEQTYTNSGVANALVFFNSGLNVCQVSTNLSAIENDLAVTTTWGRKSTLYRVTLCYETVNGVVSMLDSGFTTIQSSSVLLGR